MNYHSLVPESYKRSVVSGMVHRIIRAYSSWKSIHESLEKAKILLNKYQYPQSFYDSITAMCIKSIVVPEQKETDEPEECEKDEDEMIFLQYRGRVTDKFKYSLKI